MARKLLVEIAGDSSSLERALGKASSSTHSFGKTAGIAGAAIAGVLVVGLEKSVKAAMAAQASQIRLDQAFKTAGLSAASSAGQVDQAEASARKLGFTGDDVKQSLGSLVTATGSVKASMSELGVAEDLARFKGVGLTDATKMLTMAQTGSQRAAKQLGITVAPVTAAQDALKASSVDLTSVTGKLELAHAKLQDKMATGQAVIDAVNAKVQGQGDAFAATAAGGMAQFHAQLGFLEEKIGTAVLPALTKLVSGLTSVVTFVSEHWPQISKVVTATFNAVKAKVDEVMPTIKAIIVGVITAVEAFWHTWGGTIIAVTRTALTTVGRLFHDVGEVISGVVSLIGDVIHGRWAKIWGDLTKIVSHEIDAAKAVLTGAVEIVGHIALSIGHAIIDGILNGVSGLYSSLKSKLEGTLKSVLSSLNPFSPVEHGGYIHIGLPLAQGAIKGWLDGIAPFGNIISDNLNSLMVAGHAQITSGIRKFTIPTELQIATAWETQQSTAAANAATIGAYESDLQTIGSQASDGSLLLRGTPGWGGDTLAVPAAGGGDLHVTISGGTFVGAGPQELARALYGHIQAAAASDMKSGGSGVPGRDTRVK